MTLIQSVMTVTRLCLTSSKEVTSGVLIFHAFNMSHVRNSNVQMQLCEGQGL